MTSTATEIAAGELKMNTATKFLLRYQAFFATILLTLEVILDNTVGTMGVDGKRLWWSVDFVVRKCRQNKVTFILLHEVMHVALKHMLRKGHRDHDLWNQACDLYINMLLVRMGLKYAMTDREFMGQTRDFFIKWTNYSNEVYRMPDDGLLDPSLWGKSEDEIYKILEKNRPEDSEPEKCPWGEFTDAVNENGEPLTAEETADVSRDISRIVATAEDVAKARGQMPAIISDTIDANKAPSQAWEDIIEGKLDASIPKDLTYDRPHRYHFGGDLLMPSISKDGVGHVGMMLDASGSVSTPECVQAFSDSVAIVETLAPERITLIQFDHTACEPETIEQGELPEMVRRRTGGTNFRAPFEMARDRDLMDEFDVIVFFTDGGDNRYPEEHPDCPVIWATTGAFWGGDPPFGEVVQVRFDR